MALKAQTVEARTRKESQLTQIMHRLRKNKVAMAGLYIIILLIAIAVFSPLLMPYDYTEMDMKNMYATPSQQHFFGCVK